MRKSNLCLFIVLLFCAACKEQSQPTAHKLKTENMETEKQAILDALQGETKAAFGRDYEKWKTHWVHRSTISKTYMNFADTTFSEMIGWKEIDDFVRVYLEEHPEPVPPPAPPENVAIQIYGTGAWVRYEIMDEVFGKKRETRLMEKEKDRWKIAGMHTTIYGFEEPN